MSTVSSFGELAHFAGLFIIFSLASLRRVAPLLSNLGGDFWGDGLGEASLVLGDLKGDNWGGFMGVESLKGDCGALNGEGVGHSNALILD